MTHMLYFVTRSDHKSEVVLQPRDSRGRVAFDGALESDSITHDTFSGLQGSQQLGGSRI